MYKIFSLDKSKEKVFFFSVWLRSKREIWFEDTRWSLTVFAVGYWCRSIVNRFWNRKENSFPFHVCLPREQFLCYTPVTKFLATLFSSQIQNTTFLYWIYPSYVGSALCPHHKIANPLNAPLIPTNEYNLCCSSLMNSRSAKF